MLFPPTPEEETQWTPDQQKVRVLGKFLGGHGRYSLEFGGTESGAWLLPAQGWLEQSQS